MMRAKQKGVRDMEGKLSDAMSLPQGLDSKLAVGQLQKLVIIIIDNSLISISVLVQEPIYSPSIHQTKILL